jgi:hypothetical protein
MPALAWLGSGVDQQVRNSTTAFPSLSDLTADYAIASFVVTNGFCDAACKMQAAFQRMWTMNPTYYTVTRFLWSTALKCEVWFRLT